MIIYINEVIKKHKSSLSKYIMEILIERDYNVVFVEDRPANLKYDNSKTYYIDKNGIIYNLFSGGANGWWTISPQEVYKEIQKDNKNEPLTLQEWREIFLMAASADFATANLSFRLIKNTLISESELVKVILMLLNKFKNNTNIKNSYPEFVQDLDYLNRILLPLHFQGVAEELSVDLLVNTIRAAKADKNILSILNDEVIKKLFTRKYDHWINIQLEIKGV